MAIRVEQIHSGGSLADFHFVADAVYDSDKRHVKKSPAEITAAVLRPEFAGRQSIFVAYRDAAPVARVVARQMPALTMEDGKSAGTLGFFESQEDEEAVRALLGEAMDSLKRHGIAAVLGPMDGDTWHRYRFNVGPWDDPPFLMEPYNPSYYPGLWERMGFHPIETYYSKVVDDPEAARQGTQAIAERALKRYALRPFKLDQVDAELEVIYRISCRIFAANRFYTEIPMDEFKSMYHGVGALLRPGFNWFAQDARGEDVGFVFAFPDYFHAIQAMRGESDLLAKIRFLLNRSKADAINIKTLGVVPEHQRTGVAMALMNRVYSAAVEQGYRRAKLCLVREGNPSGKMDGGVGRVFRKYVLYHRELA